IRARALGGFASQPVRRATRRLDRGGNRAHHSDPRRQVCQPGLERKALNALVSDSRLNLHTRQLEALAVLAAEVLVRLRLSREGLRLGVEEERFAGAIRDVAQVAESRALVPFFNIRVRSLAVADAIEEIPDVHADHVALGLLAGAVAAADLPGVAVEEHGSLVAVDRDAVRLPFRPLVFLLPDAVFPDERATGGAPRPGREIERRNLRVRRLLLVVVVVLAAGAGNLRRRIESHDVAGGIEAVDAVVADLAGAQIPEPVPVVVEAVLGERSFGRRPEPEGVIDAGGNGFGFGEADVGAAAADPGAGEGHLAELAAEDVFAGGDDARLAAPLRADLHHFLIFPGGLHHAAALDQVVRARLLAVDVLAGLAG